MVSEDDDNSIDIIVSRRIGDLFFDFFLFVAALEDYYNMAEGRLKLG